MQQEIVCSDSVTRFLERDNTVIMHTTEGVLLDNYLAYAEIGRVWFVVALYEHYETANSSNYLVKFARHGEPEAEALETEYFNFVDR